ncbi:MAG: UDP-glucuronic acid decarboxylase family protein [Methanobacteriota archaeon]
MGKKTALVTGGAGFIGSWLCERLVHDGLNVVCVDNMGSGSRRNVSHLSKNKNFKFIEQDVTKQMKIQGKVDYIFNMASRASPVDFDEYGIEILMTNSLGTRNVLELAREKKARFLLASSSEVYGDPLEHPQRETYRGNVSTTGPRSPYDESKRFAESLAYAYRRNFGLDIRIARIFNTYGPRMRKDDGRVVPNFITQALDGRPITVYGDGSQTRSFCYVGDLTDGLMRLMIKDGLSGEIANLGNPSEITVLKVAELIKELISSKSKIVFKPLPKDDPVRRRPDVSKVKKLLGWSPKVPLEKGLLETIKYFK